MAQGPVSRKPSATPAPPNKDAKPKGYALPVASSLQARASHLVKQGFKLVKVKLPPKR